MCPPLLALVPAAMAGATIAGTTGGLAAMTALQIGGLAASTIAGTVGALGSISSANAQAAQGKAAQQEANYEAEQNQQNANNAAGSGQRAEIAQNKNTALVESNLNAGAAGAGGTTTDPSTLNDAAVIGAEGNYRAANALYEGNAKAQEYRNQAAGDIYQGNLTNQAAQTKSQTTLINGASSLFQKYGSSFGGSNGDSTAGQDNTSGSMGNIPGTNIPANNQYNF